MKPRGEQGATRPSRVRRIAALALAGTLAVAASAGAQDVAPDPAPPAPDPVALPGPAPVERSAPAMAQPGPAQTQVAPAVRVVPEAAAPTPPASRGARDRSRTPAAERPRREAETPFTPVRGDTPWDRAAAAARDDSLSRAGLGLLALCMASAGLQVLSARLRRSTPA